MGVARESASRPGKLLLKGQHWISRRCQYLIASYSNSAGASRKLQACALLGLTDKQMNKHPNFVRKTKQVKAEYTNVGGLALLNLIFLCPSQAVKTCFHP